MWYICSGLQALHDCDIDNIPPKYGDIAAMMAARSVCTSQEYEELEPIWPRFETPPCLRGFLFPRSYYNTLQYIYLLLFLVVHDIVLLLLLKRW